MFRQNLKNNIKNEIICNKGDNENFAKFIEIVIEFDNKLYERVMKKYYDQSKDRTELIYESNVKYVKTKHQLYIRSSEYTDLASIKLDMI